MVTHIINETRLGCNRFLCGVRFFEPKMFHVKRLEMFHVKLQSPLLLQNKARVCFKPPKLFHVKLFLRYADAYIDSVFELRLLDSDFQPAFAKLIAGGVHGVHEEPVIAEYAY